VKDRLILLLNAIKSSDGIAIEKELIGLEEIAERESSGLPPELAHLLKRRSYAKAFAYLEGALPVK
jgi:hypothetical protein